jgi:7-cyano-7-deazaguanine synthase
MCGISAFFNIDLDTKLEILKGLEIRGRDGFGFVSYQNDKQTVSRSLKTPTEFFVQEPYDDLQHAITLANTRAIPTTEFQTGAGPDIINQQPFVSERFLWVFNGLIANDKELIQKYDLRVTAPVDTAMIGPLFEKVGVIEGMRMLDGGFAIICFDKKERKLYFGKNFLPLVYWQGIGEELVVASLKEMLPEHLQPQAREVTPYSCTVYSINTAELQTFSLYRKERNKKVLIIFSSGIDSVVTTWIYKYLRYDIDLVHFTYGQAAESVERFAAEKLAESLNIKLNIIDVRSFFSNFKDVSKLLSQTRADESQQIQDSESTLSYVPNRNGIFAMVSAALAEKMGCDTVAYGGQQMSTSYPDNTIDFVKSINETLKYSLDWQTNVKFAAPLIHLIKHEIVKVGLFLGVPFDLVCSCYYPELVANNLTPVIRVCGKCGCCQFRFSAFKMIGVKDTQLYKELPTSNWFEGLSEKLNWDEEKAKEFITQYIAPFC